jgi:hypothetical protein
MARGGLNGGGGIWPEARYTFPLISHYSYNRQSRLGAEVTEVLLRLPGAIGQVPEERYLREYVLGVVGWWAAVLFEQRVDKLVQWFAGVNALQHECEVSADGAAVTVGPVEADSGVALLELHALEPVPECTPCGEWLHCGVGRLSRGEALV